MGHLPLQARGLDTYMHRWLSLVDVLHEITGRGLQLLDGKTEESKARSMEAHDLFSLMEEDLPMILARLEQQGELPNRGDKQFFKSES